MLRVFLWVFLCLRPSLGWTTATINRPISLVRPLQAVAVTTPPTDIANEDDDEYEYIEYDQLTEQEFVNSEWLVGTNWDKRPNKIEETWVRLVVDDSGKNVAVWGDQSQGTWSLDVATQFFSISKESLWLGKEIWACSVNDYYFLGGTVRGWTYWAAASVLGQWQARRLGVDPDEAGVAPWFEEETPQQEEPVPDTSSVEAQESLQSKEG